MRSVGRVSRVRVHIATRRGGGRGKHSFEHHQGTYITGRENVTASRSKISTPPTTAAGTVHSLQLVISLLWSSVVCCFLNCCRFRVWCFSCVTEFPGNGTIQDCLWNPAVSNIVRHLLETCAIWISFLYFIQQILVSRLLLLFTPTSRCLCIYSGTQPYPVSFLNIMFISCPSY